ncbi:MAG: hypothetical protein ACREBJ_11425 [Nitrosotalea sp.]
MTFIAWTRFPPKESSPLEFFFNLNFAWIIPYLKKFFRGLKRERLSFNLGYKYKLSAPTYGTPWSLTDWKQDIHITGKHGISYSGTFTFGSRPDGFYTYNDFLLGGWGNHFFKDITSMKINLLDIDIEMQDILERIHTGLDIPASISSDTMSRWKTIIQNIDNFEAIKARRKK